MQDLHKTIRAEDYRSVTVDQDEDGVYLSIHLTGAYAACSMSRASALELISALKTVLGVNHEMA